MKLDRPDPFAWFVCKHIQRRVFCGWICRAQETPSAALPHRPLCLWRWWWQGHRGTPCPQRCCSPQPGGGSWRRSSYQDTEIQLHVCKQLFQNSTSLPHVALVVSEIITSCSLNNILKRENRPVVKPQCILFYTETDWIRPRCTCTEPWVTAALLLCSNQQKKMMYYLQLFAHVMLSSLKRQEWDVE